MNTSYFPDFSFFPSRTWSVGSRGAALFSLVLAGLAPCVRLQAQTVSTTGDVTPNTAVSPVWNVGGGLTVGDNFSGTLSIEAGGQVFNTVALVGEAGTTGEVTVTGAGSLWASSGSLTLGNSGAGVLTIANGGLVTVGEFLQLGGASTGSGILNLATGGTLEVGGANGVRGGAGAAAFNFAGGTLRVAGSDLTTSLNASLTAASTIDTNGLDATFSGVLSGAAGLAKAGTGVLTLTGANTYAGVTTISAGTLQIGAGGTSGSLGTGNVTNNAVLAFDRSDAITVTNLISGTGELIQQGGGTLTLTRANTYSGGTTLAEGTLRIGNNAALGTGTLTVEDGTTLATNGSARTITNNLVVNGDFSIFPAGTIVGINAFSLNGAIDLTGGTRTITNPSDFSGGEFGQVSFGGVISNGGLRLVGLPGNAAAFFRMNGAQSNTYTGDTLIGEGISLQLAKTGGAIAIAGNVEILNDGVAGVNLSEQIADTASVTVRGIGRLQLGAGAAVTETIGSLFGDGLVTLEDAGAGSTLRVGAGDFSGVINEGLAGGVSLEKISAGTLVLTGDNTYLGNTVITAGILQVGDGGTTGALGAGDVTNNAALVFDRSDDFTFENVISGTGTLTQQGSGVLTLTAANTYAGVTTISAGTLRIGDGGTTGSLGTGNVTNNATLAFDRSDDITVTNLISGTGTLVQQGAGALTLTRANTHNGGTTLAEGTLRIANNSALGTGTLTMENGTTLSSDGNTRTIANALVLNGDVSILPEDASLFRVLTLNGAINLAGGTRTITNPSLLSAGQFGRVTFGGAFSNGGLTLVGPAAGNGGVFFTMNGAQSNTYTGTTTIGELVSLQLAKTGGATAIAGDLIIENDGVAVIAPGEQIADTSAVTIDGIGRLQVGNGAAVTETVDSLSGDGEVRLYAGGGNGSTVRTGSGEFDGQITGGLAGTTSLEKISAGTLVLTGANTYLGNTVISGGTLQVGDGGITGALGAGDVTNNAALVFERSDSFTVANAISGTGTLAKQGAGVLTLTGVNTYAGDTTVTGGLIEFTAADNLGTGNVTLDGGGLRWAAGNTTDISARLNPLGTGGGVFDTNGNDVAFAGVLGGAGQLTKTGAGALTLAGANTYTGGTLVLGGELVISTESLPGDAEVGAGAFLTFDQTIDGTYSGHISGAGSVTTNGDGTVTLAAVQTYTGQTTINAGALQGTTAIIADRDITMAAGAGLIFNQASNGTYAGQLSGAGGLAKLGAGTVNLTADQTYTGPTLVIAGGLRVNGALASTSVTVGSGAFLGGSGVIAGAVVVQSGGLLAPGNSPGILTVGSLVLNAGSFTQMEINGAGVAGVDYDQIRVTGEATLGGTLELLLGGGYVPQAGDRFVLVDADTITAGSDFDVVNGLGNALTFTATITDDYTLAINVTQTDFESFALTPNQRAVARNLDSDWTNPAMEPVIDALNALPGTALPAAFDLIAPEEYAAMPRFVQSNTRAMWSGLRQRLAEIRGGSTGWSVANLNVTGRSGRLDLNDSVLLAAVGDTADAIGMRALAGRAQAEQTPSDDRRGFFVSGTGTFGDNENDGNAAGYDFAAGGIIIGTDLRLTPDAAIGVMAGYGHTETDYQGAYSNLDTETARAGLYGTWSGLNQSWLNATAGGAYHWYDSKREGLGGTASGTTEGTELNALVEAGRDFQAGRWTLTPSAGADYLWLRVDGFEENGSLAPLDVRRQTGESLRSELALTAAYRIQQGTTVWSPYVRAGWQHEFLDTQAAVEARLASGAGGIFSVKGSRMDRDSAVIGAGLQARLGPALEAGVAYSGELNNDYQSHSVNANVRLRF